MVFGWSGLMVFVEFLNEMRNPYEFFKSFSAAQTLVFLVYIVYGSYVYGLQGQYTLPVSFQGVSNYTWQSIGNGSVPLPSRPSFQVMLIFQPVTMDIQHGVCDVPQYRRQGGLLLYL